ncbi:MAG: 3-dehydroquinate synthase [Bifidobacteriaceae bacterium]|jgi:3-dehydroquinate synthase|nr:3-dehydroquinate synthase [Bifidobacteriaceae bacterium]
MNDDRIAVALDPPYDIVVRPGLLADLASHVPPGTRRMMLIFDPAVAGPVPGVVDSLRKDGFEVHLLAVPAGEAAKTVEVAAAIWQRLGEAAFTRTDLIVSLGGGATTDLAGFAAATWLRGAPVIHIPTTLLAMVDAAIGGKTAINIVEGKNLVGAFHQPHAVLCDPVLLDSLAGPEMASGMAEVIKAGLIADPAILDVVWSGPQETLNPRGPLLTELIRRAVAVKAAVVGEDPAENGRRAILNYGHTFGHAIEQVERFEWRHGDAVAVGMVFAAEVSVRAGLMEPSLLGLHRELLAAVGLPTSYRPGRWDQLWPAMRRDKKNQGATRRMVLLEDIGQPVIVRDIPEELLRQAYQAVCAVPGAEPYPAAAGQEYALDNPYGLATYIPPADQTLLEGPAVGPASRAGADPRRQPGGAEGPWPEAPAQWPEQDYGQRPTGPQGPWPEAPAQWPERSPGGWPGQAPTPPEGWGRL